MKNQTATAKAMNDSQLECEELRLRRSIPADQSLLDAIKRERRSRKRKATKGGEHGKSAVVE